MNQYTDIQIIECNRLHSEEAKVGNNENFALWQNNLQDIFHLEAGDRVSVHGAMISERGAGQPGSIEIKGINTGAKKTFNFTEVKYLNASDFYATGYDTITCNASSKEIDIRDDTLTFNQSYYQTANGNNYIHLPRRWWYENNKSSNEQWSNRDSLNAGLSRHFVNFERDNFSFNRMYHVIDATPSGDEGEDTRLMKPRNDNKRYTIMMRDVSYFSYAAATGFPPFDEYQRDPENTIYRTYKELKQITLPNGFNSAEFISTEITRQFQKINEEKIWKYGYSDPQAERENIPVPFYRTIATESYKPFNVAHFFREVNASFNMIENAFKEYYIENASSTNASGWDYLSQYHVVACDKPDLYEAGRVINERFSSFGNNSYEGIGGARLKYEWTNTNNLIVLDISYNKDFCDKFKKFIETEAKYPEIWDYFKDNTNDYSDLDTIDNSRWVHINRWKNASLTSADPDTNAMLGTSYYTTPTWFDDNRNSILNSLLLPIYYDSSQKDTFYEYNASAKNPLIDDNKFSYGCISSNASGLVVIKATDNNGFGTPVYTELLSRLPGDSDPTTIEAGRKIGFDMHFNAPGLSWILPYAGYSAIQTSFSTANSSGTYNLDTIDNWSAQVQKGYLFVNKLYFGATSPALNWTGTNFAFSDLHTPLNRSQDVRNKNPLFPDYEDKTLEAGDVVYKINPIELMIDYTPDRKPYVINPLTNGSISMLSLNKNLLPWQIYDNSTGIFLSDFNLTENEWNNSLWKILGFTYNQFNSQTNNRLVKTDNTNVNNLQFITTNAEIGTADSKIYVQNAFGAPLYNNMMPISMTFNTIADPINTENKAPYYAPIIQKTESIQIVAENLPTRMIRGYYCLRSNILQETSFVGGKVNNTMLPIIGIVDKMNPDGDFYFSQESSLEFTITKQLRLASITTSICDPDGSYANVGDQCTVLIKVQKPRAVTFDIAQELLQEQQQQKR